MAVLLNYINVLSYFYEVGMKVYDRYLINKEKYNEYVILIESGIFIEVFDRDALIINRLVGYKLINNGSKVRLGFPIKIINKVIIELNINHINYVVIDKNNSIIDKKKYKKNNYINYVKNYNLSISIDSRINNIYNRLKGIKEDNNIDSVLSSIESILN